MDVSVIIVNWNTRKMLLDCIESIISQSKFCTTEIIVVDNGSEDGSQEAIINTFPFVTLINNGINLGFSKANNIGIKYSKGKYICLVNSDVILKEGCIDKMYEYMENNPPIGVLGPRILNPNNTLQVTCKHFPSLWTHIVLSLGIHRVIKNSRLIHADDMEYFDHAIVKDVDFIVGCFMMVRRDALNIVGLMDERFFIYYEEVDWCKRFWKSGWRVTFNPEAKAIHYNAGSSSRNPVRFSVEQQKALLQYWEKHHSRFSNILLICILTVKLILRIVSRYLIGLFLKNVIDNNMKLIENNKACLVALFQNK
jgi:GT2 family glycosyltransferase